MSKVKRNLGYQTLYQILVTCMPLITAPYLSRVLGTHQLGVFSFTNSIVSYFCLFAILGCVNYGSRSIATCGDNKELRSITFWEIYLLQFTSTFICFMAFVIYLVLFCYENQIIVLIQGINILAVFTDFNWLYFGVEDFKITVTRSSIIKVTAVVLILLLVKSPNDLWVYTLIMTASTFISNIILWSFVKKYVSVSAIKKVKLAGIKKHIKPNLKLFVPLMAMQIYHVMDKTMLGAMGTYDDSGFYYNADKVVSIPVGIITGFCTTMLPRISVLIGKGNDKKSTEYFIQSIKVIGMTSIAMALGIAAIANEFIPFFFGDGYESCIVLVILLAPVLVIKGYCYVARMLYLIPHHLEHVYTGSVIVGAIVNLLANLLLIPHLGAIGAVIGTVMAEFSACLWQFIQMRKYIRFFKGLLQSFIYIPFGLLMFIAVRLSSCISSVRILSILIEIAIGAICYMFCCVTYWIVTKNTLYITTKDSAVAVIKKRFTRKN